MAKKSKITDYREMYSRLPSLEDKYSLCVHLKDEVIGDDREKVKDIEDLTYITRLLRSEAVKEIGNKMITDDKRNDAYRIYRSTFLLTSHYVFEDFMLYLEINRPVEKQFYRPRMKVLKPVVQDLQDLHDGKFEELFISCPPRVGKTTIITFFLLWCMGIDPEMTNLYCSHTDPVTHAFYEGVCEIIKDDMTYTYAEIFPKAKIATQNSKLNTLDLERAKKYHTLTARSVYGTLNGACDCNGLLISDDLCQGIEEAVNPDRLKKLWDTVNNNLLSRCKESCKKLWIGTRWSLTDPTGIRIDSIENDESFKNLKYKIINIPALNDNDESNFAYDYGVGFSTELFRQRRAAYERNGDSASWMSVYQGEPIEREGTLFDPEYMNYFDGNLPRDGLYKTMTTIDVAWGSGDYVACPLAYIYEDGAVYIPDVVYNKGDKKITQPLVAKKIKEWNIAEVDLESNNGGKEYKEGVEKELERIDYSCTMTTHPARQDNKKEIRIFQQAPAIRDFYFLESGKRSAEYSQFMTNLFSFKVLGKNKHDDAPDCLSMLADKLQGRTVSKKIKVFTRPM